MSEKEYEAPSFLWWKIGSIGDPAAPFEKYLGEEVQKQIMAREVDLMIKVAEQRLETLKMISQVLKKKG